MGTQAMYIPHAIVISGSDEEKIKYLNEAQIIIQATEKTLPRPVVRDKNGKLAKDYSNRDWIMKLQEEIFEVNEAIMEDVHAEITAEELADVITVCISWLEQLDCDEKKRSEIFRAVNEKNAKRGYFEE